MNLLVTGLVIIIAGLLMVIGNLAMELDRLNGDHSQPRKALREAHDRLRRVPVMQPHAGHHGPSREPATVPSALLASGETTAHADVMWRASEPYLPPSPQGQHPYVSPEEWQSYLNAGRAVEPVRTGEHPPWTGSQPVLDDEAEAAEQMRLDYVRSHLADAAEVTPELMQEVLAGLRALPVYGEVPIADVLAAEEAPPFPYDPDYDNCAGTPGCGSERVFYRWYGADHTACPRCYMNVFGGEPDPSSVHKIAPQLEVREAERLAGTVLQ